jgi:hypothetical protein
MSIPAPGVSVRETLIGRVCQQPRFAGSDVRHSRRMTRNGSDPHFCAGSAARNGIPVLYLNCAAGHFSPCSLASSQGGRGERREARSGDRARRLRLVPDEYDQVFRLDRFRQDHLAIPVGAGRGWWQAVIPAPDGEIVTTRNTLRALLDKLGELINANPAHEKDPAAKHRHVAGGPGPGRQHERRRARSRSERTKRIPRSTNRRFLLNL